MNTHILKELEDGSRNSLTKRSIINFFINNGSSTITDLAKELELSVPTVTKLVSEMCEKGILHDNGKLETAGGRHPSLYGLNPKSGYFLGVDIKHNAVSIGLIDFKGEMVKQTTNVPYMQENTTESLDTLCLLISDFIKHTGIEEDKILNICFNISGRVNPHSGYSYSKFFSSEQPLTEILSEKLDHRVCIDNDTRSMAYGEFMRGCVKGEKDILFVNISWGIGISIIIDGKLYKGKSGFAGEFGHIHVFDNEILCHCGKKGCLETEISGMALSRTIHQRINEGEASILSNKYKDSTELPLLKDIIDAVNKEDPLAIEVLEDIGRKLGVQVSGLINLFNPELVIIGGTLSNTGDYIIEPVKNAVRKYSLNLVNRDSNIKLSKLKDDAGLIGACMAARSRIFEC